MDQKDGEKAAVQGGAWDESLEDGVAPPRRSL